MLACTLAGAAVAAPAKKAAKTAKAPAKAEFIVVESDTYAAGKEDPQLTAGIANFLGVKPQVTKLTAAEAAQDAKLAGFDYSFLPLYILKKPMISAKNWTSISNTAWPLKKTNTFCSPNKPTKGCIPIKRCNPK